MSAYGLPERDPRERILHAFAITSVLDGQELADYPIYSAAAEATHETLLRLVPEDGPWCGWCGDHDCRYCQGHFGPPEYHDGAFESPPPAVEMDAPRDREPPRERHLPRERQPPGGGRDA